MDTSQNENITRIFICCDCYSFYEYDEEIVRFDKILSSEEVETLIRAKDACVLAIPLAAHKMDKRRKTNLYFTIFKDKLDLPRELVLSIAEQMFLK
jgi:hypothetical protein